MSSESKQSRKEASHERILDEAAKTVRGSGYAGVAVADVMKRAGLTHGGFYAHFGSREAMLAAALEHAGKASAAALARAIAARRARGETAFAALMEAYLSDKHLASPESGCPIAALGSEMARQTAESCEASRRSVKSLVDLVEQTLPPDAAPGSALVITSAMVGALQMARILGNNAQGKALLATTRQTLIRQYDVNR